MPIRWNLDRHLARKGWTNARQLSIGAGIGYPAAWRIMQGEPLDRIDCHTLETLAKVFRAKPLSLLKADP